MGAIFPAGAGTVNGEVAESRNVRSKSGPYPRAADVGDCPAMATASGPEPLVVGWAELVDVPAWHIKRMRAKMDTGARTSALHVENIQQIDRDHVRFDVRLHRRKLDRRVTVQTRIRRIGKVRSSSGALQTRIFVAAHVCIGPVEREVEMSLVDRGPMIFRMLIGRSALSHAFLVDTGRRYVLTRPKHRHAVSKKIGKKASS